MIPNPGVAGHGQDQEQQSDSGQRERQQVGAACFQSEAGRDGEH